MSDPSKPHNNKAWFLVLPVVASVAFTAIIPLVIVVNYSVQDIFGPGNRVFVGGEWFRNILNDSSIRDSFWRTIRFSLQVLAIQIPLGIAIGLAMPKRGWRASMALVLMALPLLIPFNVVGTIWQIFARADIGLGGYVVNDLLGITYNYSQNPRDAWFTVLLMDTWHWTPLVALLVYAGLRSIPDAYYRAATIDGARRLAIFRYIELPRLRGVLTIAVLLRFMDSFMIYTEPFVLTGGGPGNTTNFLSISLTKIAIGQFDLGRAAAYSLVYFFFIQLFCFIFYTAMKRQEV
ncbi:MAG: sugar ABC transporter permease [Acidimicrobiia bacterium]|nr:sugar ABC transporter permease [Acidimicrobiia bacterium]